MRHGALRSGIIGAGALAVVALLVGAVGYTIYQGESRQIHATRLAELRLIGDLKTDQILAWRDERLGDAHVGAAWTLMGEAVAEWLRAPGNPVLRSDVVTRLEVIEHQHPAAARLPNEYQDAILAAPDGRLLESLDPNLAELDTATRQLIARVAASREPAMGDFVRVESSGHVYIDAGAPILDASGRPIAVLLLRSDPEAYLYPQIQSWATPSESAETLLVRRDGDDVLFLNVLRRDDPALTFRMPLSHTDVPAVAAVLGRTGEFEGTDYRGVEVLADLRPIPGTSWFLVAKVNAAELSAELGYRAGSIVLVVALAILVAGGGLVLAYDRRQQDLRRRVHLAEQERSALAHEYQRLIDLARDIFLLQDSSGRIVEVNAAAVATYGYRRDELLQLNIRDLRAPETLPALEHEWQATASPDGVLFETTHLREDGSTFPVEVSSREIDVNGDLHHESFVRDISKRRAAEAQLRRLSAAYATLAETSEAIVRAPDEAALFASICRIAVEHGGYLGAWVGVAEEPLGRIVPVASAGPIDDYIRDLRISTDPARPEDRGPTALVLREGRPYYCDDCLGDPATAPWHGLARRFGIRAFAALPLLRAGAPSGVFALFAPQPHVFDAEMRALLGDMADDVSFALDAFERDAARRRAEEALAAKEAQLAGQLDELRRWNEATLGREERALELKHEVNALLATLGQPPRYPSATDDRDRTAPDA